MARGQCSSQHFKASYLDMYFYLQASSARWKSALNCKTFGKDYSDTECHGQRHTDLAEVRTRTWGAMWRPVEGGNSKRRKPAEGNKWK